MEHLAIRDAPFCKIQSVKEVFMEFISENGNTFSFSQLPAVISGKEQMGQGAVSEKLFSVLMALKIFPNVLHSSGSSRCQMIASAVFRKVGEIISDPDVEQDSRHPDHYLLVLDRDEDLLSPLLLPWNYQAMLYEYLDYSKGEVRPQARTSFDPLDREAGLLMDKDDVFNLNEDHDPLFEEMMDFQYSLAVKTATQHLEMVQKASKQAKKLDGDLQSMQDVLDKIPEIEKRKKMVDKHFTLIEALNQELQSRDVAEMNKMEVEMTETNRPSEEIFSRLRDYIMERGHLDVDRVRIVLVFLLTQKHSKKQRDILYSDLRAVGVPDSLTKLVAKGGVLESLAAPKSLESGLGSLFRGFINDAASSTSSRLAQIVKLVYQGKLSHLERVGKINSYPSTSLNKKMRLVVFVTGGITLQESNDLKGMADSVRGLKVFTGGPTILNIDSYLEILGQRCGQ